MLSVELSEEERDYLASKGTNVKFPKGQIIFTSGQRTNEVYFIQRGWVKIYRTVSDGRQVSVGLRFAGDVIGLAELFSGHERKCSAEAMDDVSLVIIWGDEFKKMLAENYDFNVKIMQLLGNRLREAQNTVHDFISNQVQGRLALIIKEMALRSGIPSEDIVHVRLKVTQNELACMIGAARQTVSTLLNLFKEDGCIKYKGRDIVAVNIKKLDSWIE
ncbi:Crp/Fnr family transcriptional regulator [Desulfofalx alkaliphila]|uniref:Crp/Fnr family transcriptional regulator n=1 Tax=Desulfofalx alkaliphila TaxID=105483 RepID=UPI0004E10DD9|nr:Crp/Fnr family transcriptional regulator [Desulfofalx alkaliphila]